jgi:phage terminase large subunit-like protein
VLHHTIAAIRPETWEAVNQTLLASAKTDRLERGATVRIDSKDAAGRGFVLEERSGHYTPTEWAKTAIQLYRQHKADRIVAEVNNGGEMVEATLRMVDPNVPFTAVHASRGKVDRAEPIAVELINSRNTGS